MTDYQSAFRKDSGEAKEIVLEWGVYVSLQYDWRLEDQLGGSSNNPIGL